MNYVGVILAAGKGFRMGPFSSTYPKAVLPICNKKLIEYHIEEMTKAGIKEITVLVGKLGFRIVDAIGSGEEFGVKISYVTQDEALGIAHALGKLEEHVSSPFLLFLGDIFFAAPAGLGPMIDMMEAGTSNAILATKNEEDRASLARNFAVILKDPAQDLVKKVIEKPKYIASKIKGCGIYLFDLHIFDAIRRTPRTALRNEYEITDSIQVLIEDGFMVRRVDIIQEDMNLTHPEDLIRCNVGMLKRKGLEKLIGEGAKINKRAQIIHSVIGSGTIISNPIRISNSVVFNDVELDVTHNITNSIVTPERIHDLY